MNPKANSENETRWEIDTDVIFYEPRTIPAGWDLSEFLPSYSQSASSPSFEISENPTNP